MTNYLENIHPVSDELMQIIYSRLKDDRGVHIETAITAAGAIAGLALLRCFAATLPQSEQLSLILIDALNEKGAELVEFMGAICQQLGLSPNFIQGDAVPPEHQPLISFRELNKALEGPCAEIFDSHRVDKELRHYFAAYTSIRFVKAGEGVLDTEIGKALALMAIVSASKTSPLP
jgi:hypothetical protein